MITHDYLTIPDRDNPSQPNFSSKIIEENGVLYVGGYDNQQYYSSFASRSVLFKSRDFGATWEMVSMLNIDGTGECTICFVGERLVMVSRIRYGTNINTENNKISYSDDYGLTWTTKEMTGYNVHNPQLFLFDNTLFLMGRLILPDRYCLGILPLDDNLDVINIYSLDSSTKNPSFHQDYIFVGDIMRIFTHKYLNNTEQAYPYTIDLPVSCFVFNTNESYFSSIIINRIDISL